MHQFGATAGVWIEDRFHPHQANPPLLWMGIAP